LIDADYRRLKAFGGSGSFSGFVLRIVDRLLIDFMRRIATRRRLPAAVARQGALDREVYRLVFWERLPQRADILAADLRARLTACRKSPRSQLHWRAWRFTRPPEGSCPTRSN
jgi:RNA polymerase primary sigma factor